MRSTLAFLLFICLASSAHADPFDDWCKTARLPSSIAICSDPDLRALAQERQHAYDDANARLSPDRQKALLADQNGWVKSYPLACGLAQDAAPPLPLAPAIKACMAQAGRARIAYLRAYDASPSASTETTSQSAPAQATQPPSSSKVSTVTHVTISRWWCPFTSAYYPAVRILSQLGEHRAGG